MADACIIAECRCRSRAWFLVFEKITIFRTLDPEPGIAGRSYGVASGCRLPLALPNVKGAVRWTEVCDRFGAGHFSERRGKPGDGFVRQMAPAALGALIPPEVPRARWAGVLSRKRTKGRCRGYTELVSCYPRFWLPIGKLAANIALHPGRWTTRFYPMAKKKRLPKQLAILDEDLCTGCDACVAVCPVDCIDKIGDPLHPGYTMGICTIDLPVCIGCKLCAQVCPWHVITMVPTDKVLEDPHFATLVEVPA